MVIDPTLQKLKGKAQKAIGEYEIRSGKGLKEGISKARGELNEKIADARMKVKNKNRRFEDDFGERL